MSGQVKKSLYDLYPRLTDKIVATVRPLMPGKQKKTATRPELIKMMFDCSPDLYHSLDMHIMAEEYFWERSGSNAVFPDSPAVLDNLLRAKYQIDTAQGFTLPFESFFFAIPHGYTFDGVKLPSFLVTLLPYDQLGHLTTTPFTKYIGIPTPSKYGLDEAPPGAKCLSICYRDPDTNIAYLRTLHLDSKLPDVLKSESLEDFEKLTGHYHSTHGVIDSDPNDLARQFMALRLVAAFGVYNLATGGDRLVSGFPGKIEPKINNRTKGQLLRFSTIKNSPRTEADPAAREATYRTWHFRQLRDERYYKGEYERLAPGSRYVFVSDTIVGQKVTAFTQR